MTSIQHFLCFTRQAPILVIMTKSKSIGQEIQRILTGRGVIFSSSKEHISEICFWKTGPTRKFPTILLPLQKHPATTAKTSGKSICVMSGNYGKEYGNSRLLSGKFPTLRCATWKVYDFCSHGVTADQRRAHAVTTFSRFTGFETSSPRSVA